MSLENARELRKQGATLYVKNNTRALVTVNDDQSRLEVGPEGSPNSVVPLPAEKLDAPGLQKLVRTGKLEVGEFEKFQETWNDTQKGETESTPLSDFQVEVEEDASKKQLVEKKCLVTGEKVFQTQEEVRNDKPPLHDSVKHLEGEFVVRHVQQPDGGYETTWDRVKIG